MAFRGLRHYIEVLEEKGELLRLNASVDPVLEIAEITDRISKQEGGGKALLFENTGTDFPVLMNSMGSMDRIALALGVDDLNDVGNEIGEIIKNLSSPKLKLGDKLSLLPLLGRISSWMPTVRKGRGACQQLVHKDPNLDILPVLKCWPNDAGRFFTFPLVHTKDPVTGIRNIGMYRMQVVDEQSTGMHWHRHKTGARHYNEYKRMSEKMPVAVALGGDPAYTYAATAPLPDNMDEYMLAGFLRKKKVELVKCISQDLEVPADADIIIEGYVDPQEDLFLEGPFGDHTGFYSLEDWYPKFHVTCITHRKDAVYPATIVGIPPMEDAYIAKATERIFLAPLQYSVIPELQDMEIPPEGVAHNISIVKIKKDYPGQAKKVMNALWGAGQMMFNKSLVVVDGDVDIHDMPGLWEHILSNFDPAVDVYFDQGPLDVLDHAAPVMGLGGKMGIDATSGLPEEIMEKGLGKPGVHAAGLKIVQLEKMSAGETRKHAEELISSMGEEPPKIIVYIDSEPVISDMGKIAWLVSNNTDPGRDCWIASTHPVLVIDGTGKFPHREDFKRDWPNIIVSDEETVKKVDERWEEYGLGKFINSPSDTYRKYLKKGGASVEE